MVMGVVLLVHAVLAILAVVVAAPIALYARWHRDRDVYGVSAADEVLTHQVLGLH